MANNESIIALQNFINSSAFGLMPQSTQDEIRSNLAAMLKQEQEKLMDKVKASIMESVSQTLADADIDFSFVVERKNNVVTIKDYKPEPVPAAVIEEEPQLEEPTVEETEEKEEGNADEIQRNRKKSEAFSVTMTDGTIIQEKNAVRTFIKVLRTIGLEKVANDASWVKLSGWPIVSTQRRPDAKESWQEQVDGWFVYTHASNFDKIKSLLDVSKLLGLNLLITNTETDEVFSEDNMPVRNRETKSTTTRRTFTSNHDKTKFSLNGGSFTNKRRFAWQVVKTYISQHSTVTYAQLQQVFKPEFTTKRLGVVRSILDMPSNMPEEEYPQRYLMKNEELIELSDGDIITVCSQWNPERLANMIRIAEEQGWRVERSLEGIVIDDEHAEVLEMNHDSDSMKMVAEGASEGSYFGVTFADGTYIEGDTSFDTFLLTLKKIGLIRIPDVNITFGNINLVSVMEKEPEKQMNVDGVYVYKCLTEEQMMDALQQISDYFYMDLEIGTEEE